MMVLFKKLIGFNIIEINIKKISNCTLIGSIRNFLLYILPRKKFVIVFIMDNNNGYKSLKPNIARIRRSGLYSLNGDYISPLVLCESKCNKQGIIISSMYSSYDEYLNIKSRYEHIKIIRSNEVKFELLSIETAIMISKRLNDIKLNSY